MVVPSLMELRKEGESGRRKITQYTRYGAVVLGVFQSFAAAATLQSNGMVIQPGVLSWLFPATVTMTTGTIFLMWLGEQITERGVGNGISMIILVGILAGLPGAVGRTAGMINSGELAGIWAVLMLAGVVGVTAFCVFMERAQRRITVNYAKRQVGRRMMGGQSTAPAVQAEHVGRDPADLRLQPAAVSRPPSRASRAAIPIRRSAP